MKRKKKAKSLNFIISCVIYPFDVMFSFGETDEEIIKKLNKYKIDHADAPWQFESDSKLGRTCVFDSGQTLVRMPKIPSSSREYGTLQHEIFHAVEFLFERIRIKHSTDCGEAYAYLIGYLTELVYNQINKVC